MVDAEIVGRTLQAAFEGEALEAPVRWRVSPCLGLQDWEWGCGQQTPLWQW